MDRLWKAAGAAAWGAAALGGLQPFLSPGAAAIQALCPGARTVLVAAFPTTPGSAGETSPLLPGEDYHRVLHRRLAPVCQARPSATPATPSSPGQTAPRCPSWPRRSWRGWGSGAATACASCPPMGLTCSWAPSSPTWPCPPPGPGRGPSAPQTAGPASRPAPPGPWGRGGAT